MKKRYLNTLKLEEVLQKLKAGQYIFVDNEDDHYITMVDDVICERSKDGWKVNKEFFMNGNCYFEEEEPMQEATADDIDKLCWFENEERTYGFFDILFGFNEDEDLKYNAKNTSTLWKHCRRATPSEVAELTGYRVEEAE